MLPPDDFDRFFHELTALAEPLPWQGELAAIGNPSNRLIRIPTGFGKTLGVLSAWAWHRVQRNNEDWPRRLVWCLPMRVLVEQIHDETRTALTRLGLLWDGRSDHAGKVGVHLLMGGVDSGDWHLYPEHCAVLIGTQDMLLSRALNRGYASPRARWPMEFGLLNQDCLWVMDEVQLMDVGLATSGQLQAFRHEDAAAGKTQRPCVTWWMSATLSSTALDPAPAANLNQRTEAGGTERVPGLLARNTPFTLTWLEAMLRAADQRAFQDPMVDPLLEHEDGRAGLDGGDRALAKITGGRETRDPLEDDSAQRGGEHGVRGRTGGFGDVGSGTRAPTHATRHIETTLGSLRHAEPAPHLALAARLPKAGVFDDLSADDTSIQNLGRLGNRLVPTNLAVCAGVTARQNRAFCGQSLLRFARFHVCAQQLVDAALVAGALLAKPGQHVRIKAQRHLLFGFHGFQSAARDGASEHLGGGFGIVGQVDACIGEGIKAVPIRLGSIR